MTPDNSMTTVTLAEREAGEGPPLVLMHGLFGSSRNWVSVQKRLADKRHVVSLDLRNHGESGRAADMHYPCLAADVEAHLQARSMPSPLALLGHSMGGKVAMMLALTRPSMIERLIVVDIAPVCYPPHHTVIVAGLQSLDLKAVQSRRDADEKLRPAVPEDAVRGFLLQNLVYADQAWSWRIDLAAIAANLDALGDFPDLDPALRFEAPTLFICGGASDYVTKERHPAILERFPGARIVEFPGVGHWPHAQVPDEFTREVTAFLDAS